MSTYVPISYDDFRDFIESEIMKFRPVTLPGVHELVWERMVPNRSTEAGSYAVRVFSTIEGSVTREVGEDAIRVMLWNMETNRPLSFEKRVHRTKNALKNLEQRARDIWGYATDRRNRCPSCGRLAHVVVPRKTGFRNKSAEPFFSCTGYHSQRCSWSSEVPDHLKEE